jgi:hypothetical protein
MVPGMSEQKRSPDSQGKQTSRIPDKPVPAASNPNSPSVAKKELTPEEQMALYEKDLKENDWGHQPC